MIDEITIREIEHARFMHPPRTGEGIRNREANIGPIVMREVEVIPAKWFRQPIRRPDKGRAIDVRSHSPVHFRADDWTFAEACDVQLHETKSRRYSTSSIRTTSGRPAMNGPIAAPRVLKWSELRWNSVAASSL